MNDITSKVHLRIKYTETKDYVIEDIYNKIAKKHEIIEFKKFDAIIDRIVSSKDVTQNLQPAFEDNDTDSSITDKLTDYIFDIDSKNTKVFEGKKEFITETIKSALKTINYDYGCKKK